MHYTTITQNTDMGTRSSFWGAVDVALKVPSTLKATCEAPRGIRSIDLSGTLRISSSCGPGGGPVTIFRLDPPGPFCPGGIVPNSITTGPDGALWFSNEFSIGRMTTSGAVTIYPVSGQPQGITEGPDGALWFTTATGIGRITTSGAINIFTGPKVEAPEGIVAGPDGALWFGDSHSIGRITTAGVITTFPLPGSGSAPSPGVGDVTVGPDGALWFTAGGYYTYPNPVTRKYDEKYPFKWINGYIGRITTAGVITKYSFAPGVAPGSTGSTKLPSAPQDITTGPDGALWFTVWVTNNTGKFTLVNTGGHIGRITTSGQVSSFSSSKINGPMGLTSGPDGALWFTNYNYPFLGSTFGSIGRMTTSGVVTTYVEPGIDYTSDITTGPDGAMWFVDRGNDTIGRITPP